MTFEYIPSRFPTEIGTIIIGLIDRGSERALEYRFSINVICNDNSIIERSGNLEPHLTVGQRTAVLNFMAAMRLKAEQEILLGSRYLRGQANGGSTMCAP